MTSLEAYYSFLEKVNRLDSNQNVHIPRGKFVQIYNEQQRQWMKSRQPVGEGSDEGETLSDLLVDEVALPIKGRGRDSISCPLSEDFYKLSHCYVLATKDSCKDRPLVAWPAKPKNLPTLLRDSNTRPSFEYEETLYTIKERALKVYFTDFRITKVLVSYWRFARDIDLAGYTRLDGTASEDRHPELQNEQVDEILNFCALEAMRSSQNPEGFNLSATRLGK